MIKLMKSLLENIMKIKVIKKHNNLSVQKFNNLKQIGKHSLPGSVKKNSPNPGTCQN